MGRNEENKREISVKGKISHFEDENEKKEKKMRRKQRKRTRRGGIEEEKNGRNAKNEW